MFDKWTPQKHCLYCVDHIGYCADIVIGSRYHRNSKFINWPWYRNLLSRAAFLLTKGLTNVTDPTTGFFAIKKALINNVALKPIGWKIALEIMVKAKPKYIKEIPITFKPRMFGKSKLSIKEQINFLWHIINLYLYKYKLIYRDTCMAGLRGSAE